MNIDFIKWMVGYAEGFEYKYDSFEKWIISPNGDQWFLDHLINNKNRYPLLLQRAIEGINRDLNNPYSISTEQNNIEVYHNKLGMMDGWIRDDQDQAKILALKYIYEQEKK